MKWIAYATAFGLATVKFMFAAAIVRHPKFDLSKFEIFLCTCAGALFAFNLFYWSAGYFMERAKRRRLSKMALGKISKKKVFNKINKSIVKLKKNKAGMLLLSTAGVLFLSIPLSAIIIAKFYRTRPISYWIGNSTIITLAFLLTMLSDKIYLWMNN